MRFWTNSTTNPNLRDFNVSEVFPYQNFKCDLCLADIEEFDDEVNHSPQSTVIRLEQPDIANGGLGMDPFLDPCGGSFSAVPIPMLQGDTASRRPLSGSAFVIFLFDSRFVQIVHRCLLRLVIVCGISY